MTAPTGRVRITYEADSITPHVLSSRVAYTSIGAVLVPPDATVEPLEEDLRPGDVYRDADDALIIYAPDSSGGTFDNEPWLNGYAKRVDDTWPTRPLTLLVRDGQPVTE